MDERMTGESAVATKFKEKRRTCSVRAAGTRRLCLHRTFSSPVW